MKPRSMSEANTARAEEKPSSSETLAVATVPVTSLVTPRLTPWSTKKVESVTRKLGIPVRMTR